VADAWGFEGESVSLGHVEGTVTLVEGATFSICGRSGDMLAGSPQGLFFRDTRFLSRCELRVNGSQPEPLAASTGDPFSAVFVSRTRPRPGHADSTLLVFRYRYIGRGMREDIEVRNFGDEPAYCSVELRLAADFADLFEVKEGRAGGPKEGDHSVGVVSGDIVFRFRRGATRRGARVTFSQTPQLMDDTATFELIVPAKGSWTVCFQVTPAIDEEEIEPRYRCGHPVERATPVERLQRWRRQVPLVESDNDALLSVLLRSREDLGALRLFDPDHPERVVLAAGAPWFMTLFGRDSLITSWMALPIDPDLALGVLQTLASLQGREEDPRTDEQPGRILHEMRFGDQATGALGSKPYYGTADASPLFVMLLGELRRWGLAREVVDQLLPHADRALEWIERYGDRDGDGYVEYQRMSDRGLANQGWKDSWDGVRYADGTVARAPIALCEVQAYVYGAYLARHHFAHEAGDEETSRHYAEKAADLKAAFNRDFWVEDKGWIAIGLDSDKRQIDSLTSNMGHCLWTGIVDEEKAGLVARHLMSPEMFTGWGVRTLASSMGGYNPISYPCGSVWPHDSTIAAAGLMRYGFVEEAKKLVMGLLDAAATQGGRLPELFSGLDRQEFPTVVSYPTSCSPQAWAAASPMLALRTLMRFDPWVPYGKVWCAPTLPEQVGWLRVNRIPLAGGRVSVEVAEGGVKVEGLPPGLELVGEARHPLTSV